MITWMVMAHLITGVYMHERSDFPVTGDPQQACQAEMQTAIDRIKYRPEYKPGEPIHAVCVKLQDYQDGTAWHYASNMIIHRDGSPMPNVVYYTRTYPEGQ